MAGSRLELKGGRDDDGPRVVDASFLAGATSGAQLPPPVEREIAFAGRSNVGKSSLMNALMARRNLVRTSSTPGCTRQISFFRAVLEGDRQLLLVDLPGYGYAQRSKAERRQWGDLIEGYLMERPTLAAVVVLIDARRGPEEEERDLLTLLAAAPRTQRPPLRVITVVTKLDKVPASRQRARVAELEAELGRPLIGFSSVTSAGRAALWRALLRA